MSSDVLCLCLMNSDGTAASVADFAISSERASVSGDSVPSKAPRDVVAVRPRSGFKVWVEFASGDSGVLDLTCFRQEGGVFEKWDDRGFFESVTVDYGTLVWGDELDICPYLLYRLLTGASFEDIYGLSEQELMGRWGK